MYPLTPLKVYALDRALRDPLCTARLERLLAAIGRTRADVTVITSEDLPAVTRELSALWPPERTPPGRVRPYLRPLVFTTLDLGFDRPDLKPLLERCAPGTPPSMLEHIFGQFTTVLDYHPHGRDQENDCVCWPTFNFGTMAGCPHGCLYCGDGRAGKFIAVGLNLEEYMEKVIGPVIEQYPWSRVFRMMLHGDLITFEPEYGLHDLFARKLAEYEGRFGNFHTSSANVEWLADLPHRDRLIGVFSVTCEAVARDIAPGSAPAIARIEAARKCQGIGIPVRFKFKPVIPVRNWREEYARIIEQMLKRTDPECVGFGLYMWNTCESLTRSLSPELLDPECLNAARNAADKMKGNVCGPFPHETRKQIYRFLIGEVRRWNKDTLLFISTESREMWDELKDELGQDPRRFFCACSSVAVPGRRLALSSAFRYSTYHPSPL
jgi:DNA repair photolyase